MSGEDEELAYTPAAVDADTSQTDVRPQWMRQLLDASTHWLKLLPKDLKAMKRTADNIKDPLYRFFEREVNFAARLLRMVRHDLEDVQLICQGMKKQTNDHRQLTSNLTKGIIPVRWLQYDIPEGITVITWVQDFAERVKQFQKIVDAALGDGSKSLKHVHVWMGGLFSAEAYITASRQYVAQANAWALEELVLSITTAPSFEKLKMDDCSFAVIAGMRLMGAACPSGASLSLTDHIYTDLSAVQLRWTHMPQGAPTTESSILLPVYRFADRRSMLFTLTFDCGKTPPATFYERGVAVICGAGLL